MIVKEVQSHKVENKKDMLDVRRLLSSKATALGMSNMKETELRTAASELLTNMIRYAGSGTISIEQVEHETFKGIRATFEDKGPGIVDINAALEKGFSTGKSLGHGLSGCKNLVDSFDLFSEPGKGTRVVITKWC